MNQLIHASPADDLQELFDRAPEYSTVHLATGIYRQKVMVRTGHLTILGDGPENTILVFDDHANKPHPNGGEFNTFRTYTLAVCADGVTMKDLSIVNDALFPERKGQEVALSVVATGFRMENCLLTSTQDTLFLGPLPSDLIGRYEGAFDDRLRQGYRMEQHFKNCVIEGTVDFIFGCGEATFADCRIHSREDVRNIGYIAAPSHEQRQQRGFVFRNCDLTCDPNVVPGSVYLARPWRDYGTVLFENCRYGPHIAAVGFDKWSGTNRDQTARFYEQPPVEGRVSWVNRK